MIFYNMPLGLGAYVADDNETVVMAPWNPTEAQFRAYREREILRARSAQIEGFQREDCCFHPFSWAGISQEEIEELAAKPPQKGATQSPPNARPDRLEQSRPSDLL